MEITGGYIIDQSECSIKLDMFTIGKPIPTRQTNVATNPNTKTRFIVSILDVPNIDSEAKKDAKISEPISGVISKDNASSTDCDTSWPPSET